MYHSCKAVLSALSPGQSLSGVGKGARPRKPLRTPSPRAWRLQGGLNRQQHSPERRAAQSQVCPRQAWGRSGPGSEAACSWPQLLSGADSLLRVPLSAFAEAPSPTPGRNLRHISNESPGREFSSANAQPGGNNEGFYPSCMLACFSFWLQSPPE